MTTMATKKQIRERMARKREIDLAESRRTGLIAQNKDKERRKLIADKQKQREAEKALADAHKKAKDAMTEMANA